MAHALNSSALMNRAVELDVWIENPRAIALYRSFDFKVIGDRPFISSSGDVLSPDLIMRRDPV
ncbi:MAG: ribosomal protein S18 acetylase RimI-like enzyme [Candidatus Azotimanducaceae bacterium]|jgi:ribosomal protein S18 acetylase RimI-like enzyme